MTFTYALLGAVALTALACGGCSDRGSPGTSSADASSGQAQAAQEGGANSAASAAATGFAFPGDGVGQLLQSRLSPPRRMPAPPIPFAHSPRPWRSPRAERVVTGRLWPLAPVTTPKRVRLLPSDRGVAVRQLAAADVPPLTSADADRPAPPPLPMAPRTFVASPDPQAVQALPSSGPIAQLKPAPGDDPTDSPGRAVLLPVVNVIRTGPPPVSNAAIPDPFAQLRDVRLAAPLAEPDDPASSSTLPSRPTLPVTP